MTMMKYVTAIAAALALAACTPESTQPTTSAALGVQQPLSLAALKTQAKGFTVGSLMRAREVFVFYDPQCPHCANLWQETKQLHGEAKFTWIPVAIMRPVSALQGGAILSSSDPVKTMDEHEALISAGRGGMTAGPLSEEMKATIAQNTALFQSFGRNGVPFIVSQHVTTGELITIPGALSATALKSTLGW